MTKKKILKISFIVLLLISPILIPVSKGASMGPPPQPCGGPFPPCPIPLDGGVSFLLIAGAAYGGKKIFNSLKKNP